MTYVISDIHGCYDKYEKMLEKIGFSDNDTLYVLGDVLDYGPQPLAVLHDMSLRPNVVPILGNHEYAAHEIISQFSMVELAEDGIKAKPGSDINLETYILEVQDWVDIGGGSTIKEFRQLSDEEREGYLDYLEEFSLYEKVKVNGKVFILTHAGLPKGATKKNLDTFDAYEFTTATVDYDRQQFQDIILVTGHYPILNMEEEKRSKIYRKDNHIAMDTNAVFGKNLSCICLDTDEEYYV